MDGSKVADPPNSGKPDKPVDRVLAVLAMPGLTDMEKLVLAAVSTYDGPRGAFPTFATLAGLLGKHRSSITRVVRSLCDKGAITRKRLRYGNLYTIDYAFSDGHTVRPSKPASRWPHGSTPDGHTGAPEMATPCGHKQEEQEGTGIGRSSPQGERTPYPLESTRENAAPPDRLPMKGQSDGAASEKLGETETATDEDVRQAVDFTPTMRPPERRSELDEMLDRYTELKDQLTDDDLDADHRLALEAMLPGMETEIARLENGE